MLLGFNMLLWTTHVTDEQFGLFSDIKKAGYDGVELPIFEGDPEIYGRAGQALKDEGLRATAVTVIPDPEHDCTSSDAGIRAAGLDHLKWAIDCLEASGGEVLCGPFYQPLGVFSGDPPTPEERANIAEVHKQAAQYAAPKGIKLAVEPLNRYYTSDGIALYFPNEHRLDAVRVSVLYEGEWFVDEGESAQGGTLQVQVKF